MSQKSEIASNNIIFTIGNLISVIVAFVTSIVIARILGPQEFGLYSLVMVVVMFFIVFTDFIIGASLTRYTSYFLSQKQFGKIKSLFMFLIKYKIIVSVIISSILIIFPNEIALYVFNKTGITAVIMYSGVIIFISSFIEFFVAFFNGLRNIKNITLIRLVERFSKLVFPLAFIFIGLGYLGAIYGLIVSSLIGLMVVFIMLRKYFHIFKTKKSKINRNEIYRFGIWSFISSVTITIFAMTDSLMISILRTIPEIGFYKIATMWVFAIINFIPISGLVMYAYFSKKQSKKSTELMFSTAFRYTSLIVFPLAFLLSAFSEPLISIFYGEDYIISGNVLTILGFAAIPLALGSIIISYFSGINKPDITTKIVSIALLINIILNYFFITTYGIIGAAFATIIALIIELAVMFIALSRNNVKINFSHLYKPFIASCIVYSLTLFMTVTGIIELILYGIASLVLYGLIMLIIRGIDKKDILDVYNIMLNIFSSKR